MIPLLIAVAAGILGFTIARNFVRGRLRFVDAVQSPVAPLIAGAAAALVAWPAALLPYVTLTTVVVFGVAAGLGTASGARTIRLAESRRRLNP